MEPRSECQRSARGERVQLEQRPLLRVAAAVGIASRQPPPGERPGERAGRLGEAPGAALDRLRLRDLEGPDACRGTVGDRRTRLVVTRCITPPANTNSSRLTFSGSSAKLGIST